MENLLNVFVSVFAFVFGACIGSFLNVVIYRIPAELSIINPPSHCPKCSHKLGKTENIPVLGWLWLRGRCRWCHAPISIRYPLVEVATGWLFCLVFWYFGLNITTVGYWAFISWLLALALIDLDTMTLPPVLTKSGLVLGLVFQVVRGGSDISQLPDNLIWGIGAGVLGIWLLDILALIGTIVVGQEAMGEADPYLAAMIGMWLGWKYLLVTLFLSCAIGSVVGVAGIGLGRMGLSKPIPFGPYLALGAVLAVFWGEKLISSYIHLFFPYY